MNISNRYSIELNKINNHLADLEKGHIYELTKTPETPSCATLAQHLKEDITAYNSQKGSVYYATSITTTT